MDRLFIYGSLQPGGPNERVLAGLEGEWEPASVKGNLVEAGWGASVGYPGLVIDERGGEVQGYLFVSPTLSDRWAYLDEFEGEEYERIVASVSLRSGERIEAYVYVLTGV